MTVLAIPKITIANLEAAGSKCMKKSSIIIIRQILASLSLSLVCLSYGMAFAFTGTLLPLIREYVDEENGTWLAASNVFSMVIGACASIYVIPRLGYKTCLIHSEILSFSGWICLSAASHFLLFELGCILVGFSSGFAYQISLICRVEIPEPGIRGIISTVITSSYMLGVLLGHVSPILLPWRTALRCCSLAPLLTAALSAFLFPESPSWLLYKERAEEAEEIFFRLRGVNQQSQEEFKFMLEKQTRLRAAGLEGAFGSIMSPKFFAPFFIGAVLLTAQCVSGYDLIVIYSVDLLSKMSSQISPAEATILFDVVSLCSCVVSCFVVKKMTRRGLLWSSIFGTLMILVLLMVISSHQFSASVITLPVCLCAYSAFVNVGLVPVSWLGVSELFPEINRDIGICMATGYFNFLTFILTKLIPIIGSSGGIVAALGFFTIALSLSSVLLYFIMPETKALSLQEIENAVFHGKFYQLTEKLFRCNTQNKQ